MTAFRLCGAIVCLSLASGCASVMSGKVQELSFHSNPEGAAVTIHGTYYGTTPFTTPIHGESGLSASFSKPGYRTLTVDLETHVSGWFYANAIFVPVMGLGTTTDVSNGAVHRYSPKEYMVTLEPENANPIAAKPALSRAQKSREFIVVAYDKIMSDLSRGQGQYLNSLLSELEVPESERESAIKKIRALSEAYSNIAEFSEKVTEMFIKN